MIFCNYMIKESITKLKALKKTTKPNMTEEEFNTYKNKNYGILYDLLLSLGEYKDIIQHRYYHDEYEVNYCKFKNVQEASNLESYLECIDLIIEGFEEFNYYDLHTAYLKSEKTHFASDLSSNGAREIEHYTVLDNILKKIELKNDREINVFAPDCAEGRMAFSFDKRFEHVKVYGNTLNEYELAQAKEKMFKVGKGKIKGSRIQNNAFDIMYVTPHIKTVIDYNNVFENKRPEKTYLADMFKYLKNDGVMIITLPYSHLYKDICAMLSKQLENIQVVKTIGSDFESIGMVHIIGQKNVSKVVRSEEYTKLRSLFNRDNLKSDMDRAITYTLPRMGTEIELFKGSLLDITEISDILNKSSLMEKMFEKERCSVDPNFNKNPLLPFNIGQLGLVLTSGCLDGEVEEEDGCSHLIKGRVTKKVTEVEVEKNGEIELTETTTNVVQINVLLPNGEFKILA